MPAQLLTTLPHGCQFEILYSLQVVIQISQSISLACKLFSTLFMSQSSYVIYFSLFSVNIFFSSVQLLSCVWLFATPWTAACQASLSITNSWSLLKLMSIELVMPSNHLILCRSLLLAPSIFPSIRVFSDESVLCIRRPKYWSFSISPSNEYSGLISFTMGNSKNKKMKLNNTHLTHLPASPGRWVSTKRLGDLSRITQLESANTRVGTRAGSSRVHALNYWKQRWPAFIRPGRGLRTCGGVPGGDEAGNSKILPYQNKSVDKADNYRNQDAVSMAGR